MRNADPQDEIWKHLDSITDESRLQLEIELWSMWPLTDDETVEILAGFLAHKSEQIRAAAIVSLTEVFDENEDLYGKRGDLKLNIKATRNTAKTKHLRQVCNEFLRNWR